MLHPRYIKRYEGIGPQLAIRDKINAVFYSGRVVPQHTKYEHFYKDSDDNQVYPSVTTMLSVINKPYLKQWAVNRAIEYMQQFIVKAVTLSKPELYAALDKAKTLHKERLEEASMWGTDGHNLIDAYVDTWIKQGSRPTGSILDIAPKDISNEGKCAALGAEKFFNDHTLFPIVSEKKMVSKKYRIGGTLDSLWLIGTVYKDRAGKPDCTHEWLERDKNGHVVCSACSREESLSLILIDLKTSNQIISHDYQLQVSTYSAILTEMCGIKPKLHWILQLNKNKPEYTIGVVQDVAKAAKAFLHVRGLYEHTKQSYEPVKYLTTKTVVKL